MTEQSTAKAPCFKCKGKGYTETNDGRFRRLATCDCPAGQEWSFNAGAALWQLLGEPDEIIQPSTSTPEGRAAE